MAMRRNLSLQARENSISTRKTPCCDRGFGERTLVKKMIAP